MEKMKLHEAFELFRERNKRLGITRKGQDKRPLGARIVLKDTFFREDLRPIPVEKRTYTFTSDNKAFIPGQMGYSVFASCEADHNRIRIEYLEESDVESCEAETDQDAAGEYERAERRIRDLEGRKKRIKDKIDRLSEELHDVEIMIGEARGYVAELESIDGKDR